MLKSIPLNVKLCDVDIWFQDEARIGQHGTISRTWARCGTRPTAVRQLQFEYAYIFGAVSPEHELQSALILPKVGTEYMQKHLEDISEREPKNRHAVVIMDKAAWHTTGKLQIPDNVTTIPLPATSPELNPQEQIWQWLRKNHLSGRTFKDYKDIVDSACEAWNTFTSTAGLIKSIATREWAHV